MNTKTKLDCILAGYPGRDTIEQFTAFVSTLGAVPEKPKEPTALTAQKLMVQAGLDILPTAWPGIMAGMREDTLPGKRGWILCGGTGTGKTTRARMAADFAGIEIVTARSLFNDLITKPFWEASRIGSLTATRRLRCSDLVIDDLGTEPQTYNQYGNIRNPMAELLEERYAVWPKIRTYITTNLSPSEIEERYGERVASRLEEMCARIRLDGADRRRNHK